LDCSGGECTWIQHSGKKFEEYDNDFWVYGDFLSISEDNYDLKYSYEDGTEITLIPVIDAGNAEISLKNVSTETGNLINYSSLVDEGRDLAKFTVEFNKINNIDRIGFEIQSNDDIEYIDYDYIKEGIYDDDPTTYSVTDVVSNGKRYSFIDLIESGFDIEFDKKTNTLWIDVSELSGRIEADPATSFFSESQDGHCIYTIGPPYTCTTCLPSQTTSVVGKDGGLGTPKAFYGINTFNTSSLPDDSTITSVISSIYRHSLTQSNCGDSTHNVRYDNGTDVIGSTLACVDMNNGYWTNGNTKNVYKLKILQKL
jgi:hypothetical protein